MARVMPGGAPDYTSQIAAREAAANDALTRLYISLAARKEERLRQQEFLERMLGVKDQYTRGIYDDYGAPGSRGQYPSYNDYVGSPAAPLGSGGAPSGATPAAPAPTTQMPQGPMVPGATPTGPPIGKFGALQQPTQQQAGQEDPLASFAQAGPDETVTLSAQSRQQRPAYNAPRAPSTTRNAPLSFKAIDPRLMQAWNDAEVKFKLPPGTILMTLGLENAGGHNIGTNPKSAGGASGFFQFTQELAREHGLKPADLQDPYKMGYALAANIDRNRVNMEKLAGRKFTDSSEDMPYYYMAHMWGAGNAPRIAKALAVNRDVPLAKVLMPTTLPNGRKVDAATTLANNNIPLNMTVGQYFDELNSKKVAPWHAAALRTISNPETAEQQANPQQVVSGPRGTRVPQGANAANERTGYRFGDEASIVSIPFPDGSGRVFNMHKEVAPIAAEFVKRLYEAGAPISSLGGYVKKTIAGSGGHPSQHGYGTALDVNQKSKNKVDTPFTRWVQDPQNGRVLGQILADLQIRSGGDWKSKDFGHFEFGPEAVNTYKARGGSGDIQTAAVPAGPPPTPRLPSEEMRPFAGEKLATFSQKPAGQLYSMGENKPIVEKGAIPSTSVRGLIAGAQPTYRPQDAKTQIAEPAVTPTVVPKTIPVPDEVSAAENKPTPQTASTVEQKTQAAPVANTEYGYGLDPNETTRRFNPLDAAADAVYGGVNAANDFMGDVRWSVGDIAGKAGNILAEPFRTTTPQPQGGDEAGMVGIDKYVTPEAVPGEGTRGLVGGVNNVIQSIQERAKAYNTLQAGRNESRQLEQVYNYPQPQAPSANQPYPLDNAGYQGVDEAIAAQPQAPQDATTDFRDPRNIQKAQDILLEARAKAAQQPPQQPPVATPTPLPVPANKVADAIYNVDNAATVPPGEYDPSSASGPDVLSWIKGLFKSNPQAAPSGPAPVPVGKVKTDMPGGTPFIVPQAPLNIQPKGNVLPGMPAGATPQPGQLDVQFDENGNPLIKRVE